MYGREKRSGALMTMGVSSAEIPRFSPGLWAMLQLRQVVGGVLLLLGTDRQKSCRLKHTSIDFIPMFEGR